MGNKYHEIGQEAEEAVRGIRDKELRKEAFKIVLLQLIADNGYKNNRTGRTAADTGKSNAPFARVGRGTNHESPAKRPGRRGGGVATTAIQKLIDNGTFKIGRDAAGIMKELARRRIVLQPSQLRMVLLRFTRSRKLKRRIKMKGKKVTYLYSTK